MKHYLSVYCRFRDESIFLSEWLEYHIIQGVDHFYMVDHLSKDYALGVLNPYITRGLVTYIRFEEELPPQIPGTRVDHAAVFRKMGNQVLERARGETRWLAAIDSDEFLVPAPTVKIPQLLKGLEQYAALAVNWQMFGTSGVERIPPNRLLLETLVMRAERNYPANKHVKVIVQPSLTMSMGIHNAYYVRGTYAVNTDGKMVNGPFNEPILSDKLKLHHYFLRDKEFLRTVKAPRRRQFGHSDTVLEQLDEEMTKQLDLSIMPYLDELRKRVIPPPWQAYLAANPDLVAAGVETREAAQLHWLNCGKYEGRPLS